MITVFTKIVDKDESLKFDSEKVEDILNLVSEVNEVKCQNNFSKISEILSPYEKIVELNDIDDNIGFNTVELDFSKDVVEDIRMATDVYVKKYLPFSRLISVIKGCSNFGTLKNNLSVLDFENLVGNKKVKALCHPRVYKNIAMILGFEELLNIEFISVVGMHPEIIVFLHENLEINRYVREENNLLGLISENKLEDLSEESLEGCVLRIFPEIFEVDKFKNSVSILKLNDEVDIDEICDNMMAMFCLRED